MIDDHEFQAELQRIDTLLKRVDHYTDPVIQSQTREIVSAVLHLHGAGLERLISQLDDAGAPGGLVIEACARDNVVGGLLLLHGLHPVDLETRVRQALDEVQPSLRSHGGNVELVGISEGVVRLRLHGSCPGCPSPAGTMHQTIEAAIFGKAPDVTAVEVEKTEEAGHPTGNGAARRALPWP